MLRRRQTQVRFPLFVWLNALLDTIRGGYLWLVTKSVRLAVIVLVLFGGLVATTGLLYKKTSTGFIPSDDMGYFMVNIQLPDAAKLARTRAVLDQVETLALQMPGVAHVVSVNGFSILSSAQSGNGGFALVILEKWGEHPRAIRFSTGWRPSLHRFPKPSFFRLLRRRSPDWGRPAVLSSNCKTAAMRASGRCRMRATHRSGPGRPTRSWPSCTTDFAPGCRSCLSILTGSKGKARRAAGRGLRHPVHQSGRGYANDIYAQIGLVLLIALVAENAILIVEFAVQQRGEGKSVREAAIEAARLRFRPILMTAFSFILGTLPLLIASGAGAQSRRVLGTNVVAGMTLATVVGIVLVPVFYFVIQSLVEKVRPAKPATMTPENVGETPSA